MFLQEHFVSIRPSPVLTIEPVWLDGKPNRGVLCAEQSERWGRLRLESKIPNFHWFVARRCTIGHGGRRFRASAAALAVFVDESAQHGRRYTAVQNSEGRPSDPHR